MPNEGLRAKRRRETGALIRRAALDLVSEHGFDHVTVEEISTRAGVSVRTFFNYFPHKEAALIQGPQPFTDQAKDTFLAGTGDVLTDLTDLLAAQSDEIGDRRKALEATMQVIKENQQLTRLQLQRFHDFELDLAVLIGARLGLEDGDDTARLAAAVVLAAVRVGMERWAQDFGTTPGAEVTRAVADLRVLWGSLTTP